MNNDDSASAEPANSRRAPPAEADDDSGVDGRHAKSVTDLIDDIERLAFRRNISSRIPRRSYPAITERRAG